MNDAYTGRGEIDLPKILLDSLLPQINIAVRWACRCYHRFPEPSIIDDLTQEIILSLIKNDCHDLSLFEHRCSEKTWLQIVVLHRVGRYFESQKPIDRLENLPFEVLPSGDVSYQPRQEKEVYAKEMRKLLDEVAGTLTQRQRKLLELLRQELDTREIAERIGIKPDSVSKEKRRLFGKISELLKSKGWW